MPNHHSFSLKELLVSVTVIGVLFALLAPFIEQAREAARRSTCSNRFRELGLAIHNYHAVNNQLPLAMFGTKSNERRLNGMIVLTPFLSSTDLWATVTSPATFNEVRYPTLGPVPWETKYDPWRTEVTAFRCPSDTAKGPSLGRTNYAFCVGDQVNGLYECSAKNDFRGCFSPAMSTQFRDCLDGLANTIMMLEIGTLHQRKLSGQFALNQGADLADSPGQCMSLIDDKKPGFYSNAVTLSKLGRGGAFADGSGGYSLVHTILPPNSPSCAIGSKSPLSGVFSSGSFHPGGCHILMGDGATIFITDLIETGDLSEKSPTIVRDSKGNVRSPYGLWGALGTRASAEIIEEQICQ